MHDHEWERLPIESNAFLQPGEDECRFLIHDGGDWSAWHSFSGEAVSISAFLRKRPQYFEYQFRRRLAADLLEAGL